MFKYEVGQSVKTDDGKGAEVLDQMDSATCAMYCISQDSPAGVVELWVSESDLTAAN